MVGYIDEAVVEDAQQSTAIKIPHLKGMIDSYIHTYVHTYIHTYIHTLSIHTYLQHTYIYTLSIYLSCLSIHFIYSSIQALRLKTYC